MSEIAACFGTSASAKALRFVFGEPLNPEISLFCSFMHPSTISSGESHSIGCSFRSGSVPIVKASRGRQQWTHRWLQKIEGVI